MHITKYLHNSSYSTLLFARNKKAWSVSRIYIQYSMRQEKKN